MISARRIPYSGDVGDNHRTLDVFVPREADKSTRASQNCPEGLPVLLLATGLAWFQIGPSGGLKGLIGEHFNSAIAAAAARCGFVCVAVRPLGRHFSHTSAPCVALACVLTPLCAFVDGLLTCSGRGHCSLVASLLLSAFTCVKPTDLIAAPLALLVRHASSGPVRFPPWLVPWVVFAATRFLQKLCGHAAPAVDCAMLDPVCDMALAAEWTQKHIKDFGGDPTRVFLGGYSSGGHTAALALAAGSPKGGPGVCAPSLGAHASEAVRSSGSLGSFRGVVLLSGIYDFQPFGPSGGAGSGAEGTVARAAAKIGAWLLVEIFGLGRTSVQERLADLSPTAQLGNYNPSPMPKVVLINAKHELFGLRIPERLLFGATGALAKGLRARGAEVEVATSGSNHWEMALRIEKALRPVLMSSPFCD